MKQQTFILLLLALLLTCLTLAPLTQAAGQPRLRLNADRLDVVAGQEIAVQLWVEEATPVYGAEAHLAFDPTLLTVLALNHGDFFTANPAKEAFVLQNKADNKAGTIDYALALLNPAPSVEGDGLLLTIIFQAKAAGQATIRLEEGLFGTETGEEVVPMLESLELHIAAVAPAAVEKELNEPVEENIQQPNGDSFNQNGAPTRPNRHQRAKSELAASPAAGQDYGRLLTGISLLAVAAVFGLVALVGPLAMVGWFWLKRAH